MWTAKITNKQMQSGSINVVVEYGNGTEAFNESIKVGVAQKQGWIEEQIARRLYALNELDTFFASISLDALNLPDFPPKADPTEEVRRQFLNDIIALKRAKSAIAFGIKSELDADFTALQEKVKTNFKAEYLDLL